MDSSLPDNPDEVISTSSAMVETIELLWLLSMRSLAHLLFCPDGLWVIGGPSTVGHWSENCSRETDFVDPYKQDEYMALMDKFQEEKIPLAVAVVDMDWYVS